MLFLDLQSGLTKWQGSPFFLHTSLNFSEWNAFPDWQRHARCYKLLPEPANLHTLSQSLGEHLETRRIPPLSLSHCWEESMYHVPVATGHSLHCKPDEESFLTFFLAGFRASSVPPSLENEDIVRCDPPRRWWGQQKRDGATKEHKARNSSLSKIQTQAVGGGLSGGNQRPNRKRGPGDHQFVGNRPRKCWLGKKKKMGMR